MEANAFLEALYNANYERLYIYAENLLFNAAYAEEAVQETFFEAVRKQDALMRHAKPEAWLMETLKNKIRVGSRRRALEALYFISLEQDLAQESKKLAVEETGRSARSASCSTPSAPCCRRRTIVCSAASRWKEQRIWRLPRSSASRSGAARNGCSASAKSSASSFCQIKVKKFPKTCPFCVSEEI